MTKRQVFYSFHYEKDVLRTQQIRNIGMIEGNSPASANDWEEIKKKGDTSIKNWINTTMQQRSCVIVLIGNETYARPWVKYEIERAWDSNKGLFGIFIHNINCPRNGKCLKGRNPFDNAVRDGVPLSTRIACYDPTPEDAYTSIRVNISTWIETAITTASTRGIAANPPIIGSLFQFPK